MMKSQKTGEDSQNIEDIRYSCWFVVLKHSWPSFLAFEINKSILILNRAKSFLLYNESLLTKFVWSRRLDISFVLFLVFLWFDKACNIYIYVYSAGYFLNRAVSHVLDL